MKIARQSTRLDAELLAISEEGANLTTRGTIGLAARARMRGQEDFGLSAARPETVTVKLLTTSGMEQQAEQWVRDHQGEIDSAGERVLVARLPPAVIPILDHVEWLRRAEAPRRLLPSLDQARGDAATGLDTALITHALTGENVVLGIVDSGLDWRHADFRKDDGSTRLAMFAHARSQFQPNGTEIFDFRAFDTAQINSALNGGTAIPNGDPHGHGTHCASIAAGNGRAISDGSLRGVAPRATLMAVRSDELFDTHIIEGIRRIFRRAGELGLPAVVSLSLGGHEGAHDGTAAIENVIARESGPGRIVVVAAGNEGQDRIHWQGDLQSGPLEIPFRITDSSFQFVDVWVPRGDDVDVVIIRPDGAIDEPDGSQRTGAFGRYRATGTVDPISQDQNLNFRITGGTVNSQWRIRLTPLTITQGVVHAWAGTDEARTSRGIFSTVELGFSLGMPGTEERSVVVGSFISRASFAGPSGTANLAGLTVGELSPFSSRGPTRIGALKPDVVAPGQVITAALSEGCEMGSDPALATRLHPSGKYITIQGTSMATPFVAGVIALLLQKNAKLTPEDVQQRLRATAKRDTQTGRVWGPGFGFGKLEVAALLDYSARMDAQP